ncbi:MAG: DUF368 domain-containing protein [Oscillospiraceae bacterium]|jgi:putative membrane protein|nr:DUF368 domain-containing protein [Oscillospiraceae bacterium]
MKILLNVLKGIIIGGSMSVPGVSGGTMAMLLGCYSDLIHAVSSFTKNVRKNAFFLIQLAAGGGIGLLLISKLIESGLEHATIGQPLRCLFVGLVLGGLPLMYKMTKSASNETARVTDYLFGILGFVLVVLLTKVPENILNLASGRGPLAVLFLLIAGFVVAIGLVLPGISAMGMIAALGLFETVNSAISNLDLALLVPLGAGGLVGIFGTTRIIEKLMDKFPRKTYLLIIGFVLGSVLQVLPDQAPQGWEILFWILAAAVGFALIMLLSRLEDKKPA